MDPSTRPCEARRAAHKPPGLARLLLALLGLCCAAAAQAPPSFVREVQRFASNSLEASTSAFTFKYAGEHTGYLLLSGSGEVKLSFVDPTTQLVKTVTCRAYQHKLCPLWNAEADPATPPAARDVEVKYSINCHNFRGVVNLQVQLFVGEAVELVHGSHNHLLLENVASLDVFLVIGDNQEDPANPLHKVQLRLEHNQWEWLNYQESIGLKARIGPRVIGASESTRHYSSTLGLGVIATIKRGDPDFCASNCVIAFKIIPREVASININSEISPVEPRYHFGWFGFLKVDHLLAGESVRYLFESDVPENQYYSFSLVPIEGNPDMFVNEIENVPEDFENYRWKTEENTTEIISINQKQLKFLNITKNKYYVGVKAAKDVTYALQVEGFNFANPPLLMLNTPYTGQTFEGEVANYLLFLTVHEAETYNMTVYLKALSGNPDLYMKECPNRNLPCEVTTSDISNKQKLATDAASFFRYSDQLEADDFVPLTFNCIPFNPDQPQTEEEKLRFFNNSIYSSFSCLFAIAVHGRPTATDNLSKFQLMVRGQNHHEPMLLDYHMNFRGYPNQDILYSGHFSLKPDTQSLVFTFNIVSGDADIFVSRTNPFPTQLNCDKALKIDNDATDLFAKTKTITFASKDVKDLQGKYYLRIQVASL